MKSFKLSSGYSMPGLGLGTWRSEPKEIQKVITAALAVGYTHFDCAYVYENEKEIGEAFKDAQVDRSKLFITSKLWNTFHQPHMVKKAIQETLADFQMSYLDLYLVHWPIAQVNAGDGNSAKDESGKPLLDPSVTIEQTWAEMEKLVDQGLTRSIGVSNFTIDHLKRILKVARIKPAVNQVEMHPYLPQNELVEFCKQHDILITAYSPLGSSPIGKPDPNQKRILSDETIERIAKKHSATPAQVLINWALDRDTSVIPKSSNPDRIKANFKIISLDAQDMKDINDLHKSYPIRYVNPKGWWGVDIFNE